MIRVGIQGSSSPVSPVMETDAHASWEKQLRTRWTWQWPTKGDSSFGDRRHAANDVMTMTLFIIDGRKTASALFRASDAVQNFQPRWVKTFAGLLVSSF